MSPSILKNSLAVFASRVANGAAQLAVTLLVARALPVAAFGRFAFGITLGNIAAVVAESGTGLALVRDIAEDRGVATAYFGTVFSVRILASLAVLALGAGLPWLVATPALAIATVLGIGIGLTRGLSRHATALFYAFERMEIETWLLLVEGVAIVAAATAGVLLHAGLPELMGLLLGGYGLGLLARFTVAGRLLGAAARPRWNLEVLARVRRQALAYGVFALASVLFVQIDVPVATVLLGAHPAGIYQAASKIFVFLMLVPQGISNAMLPAAARQRDGVEGIGALAGTVAYWLGGIALPVALGGGLLAGPIIGLLYGHRYAGAAAVFVVLMIAVPLRFYTFVQGTVLTAAGRQATRARVMAVGAVTAVVGTCLGAWIAGVEGIAASRLVAEVVVAAGYAWGLGRVLARAVTPTRLLRLLLPALALAAAVLAIPSAPVALRIAAGAGAYLAVALLTGALRVRELGRVLGGAR